MPIDKKALSHIIIDNVENIIHLSKLFKESSELYQSSFGPFRIFKPSYLKMHIVR
jgi:hypothetical protein